ncbi:11978_t:CDS:2 [Gigaspora margarita]|uniref:11978_t:CDS:1 n=1 Tax=Gigaspora margarita TaxID=4874 RepID=A0ABN7VYK5_GIGMA|nr:11978_t:CDS:2 [Gigaspora margarita]
MWLKSNRNSDVKIIVGSEPNIKEFGVHSSVLRSCSLYFQRALSERWKNKKHDVYIMTMPNIHPNIFMLILDYIYTGKIILNTSAEDYLNLLVASDELELLEIAEFAQKRLIKEFTPWLFSNLAKSLNIVCRHNHFQELHNLILKFTFSNPYSLFNSVGLSLLDEIAMIFLLESDELELEEIEVWNCLIKWGVSKILDEDITNWSNKNVSRWSDEHFKALKETISHRHKLDYYRNYSCGIPRKIWKLFKFFFPEPLFKAEKKPYFSQTSNSFIFSFTDQSNPVLSRVKDERKNEAIWNNELCGPSFGLLDLCMKDSNRWISYWGTYEHKITNSKKLTEELIVEEYEVLAFDNYNPIINN